MGDRGKKTRAGRTQRREKRTRGQNSEGIRWAVAAAGYRHSLLVRVCEGAVRREQGRQVPHARATTQGGKESRALERQGKFGGPFAGGQEAAGRRCDHAQGGCKPTRFPSRAHDACVGHALAKGAASRQLQHVRQGARQHKLQQQRPAGRQAGRQARVPKVSGRAAHAATGGHSSHGLARSVSSMCA